MGASIINDVTGFTDPKMVEFVKSSKCGVVIAHAGELAEPAARAHKEVQLDTSAAAFVAEKARAAAAAAAAEAAAAAAPKKRSRAAGAMRLVGGLVQPQLPFADIPNGSAAAAEKEAAKEQDAASTEAPAAPEAAPAPAPRGRPKRPARRPYGPCSAPRGGLREHLAAAPLHPARLPPPSCAASWGFLSDQARALVHAGVARERICIDPGAGFGKGTNEDIIIQRETAKMASLGYPLMCAVSRKRFVGAVSGVTEAADRDAATFGVCLGAIQNGANVVRVHDVAGFAQFLNGYWAVARPQPRRALRGARQQPGPSHGQHPRGQGPHRRDPAHLRVQLLAHLRERARAYEERQEPFANAVIEIRTELAPLVLLDELMKIEDALGRNRTKSARPNGPRTLDCDLLWMDGEVHGGDKLRLPHPKLGERDFVLIPLEDLMHDPARFFRYEGVDVKEPEGPRGDT